MRGELDQPDEPNRGILAFALPFALAGCISGFLIPRFAEDSSRIWSAGLIVGATALIGAALGYGAAGVME